MLVQAGAQKDWQGDGGNTALICACREGHVEAVSVLLKAGANKDLKGDDGSTALICACKNRHIQVARVLLEAVTERVSKALDFARARQRPR